MDGWMAIWWMVCGASGRLDTPAVVYACCVFLVLGRGRLACASAGDLLDSPSRARPRLGTVLGRVVRMSGQHHASVDVESKNRYRRQMRWPRFDFWHSRLRHRPYEWKVRVVAEPWNFPITALNLAAVQLQRTWRGVLTRRLIRRLMKSHGLAKALATMRARAWRPHWRRPWNGPGHRLLAKYLEHQRRLTDQYGHKEVDAEPATCLSPLDPDCTTWIATRVQAWWRMVVVRREYVLSRFAVYHIAAMQIQYLWRFHCQSKYMGMTVSTPEDTAAQKIQFLWRSYTNRRIYFYYRDLIKFRNAGDPALMLRCINPREAALLDVAAGIHIRFRLGGSSFPPVIVYKVFTHKPLCDVNAFAPRDYTVKPIGAAAENNHPSPGRKKKPSRRRGRQRGSIVVGKSQFETKYGDAYDENDGSWYQREDMNNWRPVTLGSLEEADMLPEKRKVQKMGERFHYSKVVRRQDKIKREKRKKREWLMKLHREGLAQNQKGVAKVDLKHEDWEEQADQLLDWSTGLDFDDYLSEWASLGTSGPSNPARYEKSVLEDHPVHGNSQENLRVRLGRSKSEIMGAFEDDGLQ